MEIRVILAPVSHADSVAANVEAAFAVGKAFGSHVAGLHVRADPRAAIPYVGEGMTADIIQELCNAAERDGLEKCATARATFDRIRRAASAPLVERPHPANEATAGWEEAIGDEAQVIASRSRIADLSVVRRPGDADKEGGAGVLEGILFRSGRAALVVPASGAFSFPKSVAIAWNGSAEAARAVAFAMPFIAQAEHAFVMTAGEPSEDLPDAAGLSNYMSWHGIAIEPVRTRTGHESFGALLLGEAKNLGAELIVMGAYTHSRWREMILGGVTRYMLTNSDLPLLLVH
ncbi:MAG: universal stress protein [Sphingomonadales bacterium]